jgi:hypothetical protein
LTLFVGENQISPIFAIPKNIAIPVIYPGFCGAFRRLDW